MVLGYSTSGLVGFCIGHKIYLAVLMIQCFSIADLVMVSEEFLDAQGFYPCDR